MGYDSKIKISSGRSGEDIPGIREKLGKLFGESLTIRKLEEREEEAVCVNEQSR